MTGPFSKITSPSTGLYQTTVGEVVLQITTGDITTEDTDVIVNSSNENFTLNSGRYIIICYKACVSFLMFVKVSQLHLKNVMGKYPLICYNVESAINTHD